MVICIFYFVFLILSVFKVASSQINPSAETDFSCSSVSSPLCDTYVTYRASPPLMDLGSISDLLGVSRLSIARASGLASEGAPLFPDQILLVPIKCFCNGSHYFSNVTYQIKKGDNFYSVSTGEFQNLTRYHFVIDMNPTLKVTNLTIGEEAVIPLLCKCAYHSDVPENGIPYLITYVWQPFDDLMSVTKMFGTSRTDVVRENNYRNFSNATCLPVLIPVKSPMILQPSPSQVKIKNSWWHKWKNLVTGLCVAGFLLIVSLCLTAYKYFSHKKKRVLTRQSSCLETSDLIQIKKGSKDETIQDNKLLPGVSGYLGKPIVYDLNIIMEATMNLSEQFRIGGSVYKVAIKDQILAVKKTRDSSEELRILQRVNHANLVKLMGVSSDKEKNLYLVYEYVENGSLDKWLFTKPSSSSSTKNSVTFLTWSQRLQIALDIANALQYLHEHAQPSIAHRDIRTSNILLDSRFKAKIANFSTTRLATSEAVVKADVFAFGIVLLELISGRKGMESRKGSEIVMLWKEIIGVLDGEGDQREEMLRKWMDPCIMEDFYSIDDAMSLAALAKACTLEKSSERPKMTDIVFSLSFLNQQSMFGMYQSCSTSCDAEEPVQIICPVSVIAR